MKFIKSLGVGLFALAFSALAPAATTYIYLVGSTAYRASVHAAIINELNAGGAYVYASSSAGSSSGAAGVGTGVGASAPNSGASQAIYSGTIAGHPVIIKTDWSGSAGGIQVVSQSIGQKFFVDGVLSGATNTGSTVVPFSGANVETDTPSVAMSDGFQSSTTFTAPALTAAQGAGGSHFVGVVPFVFVVNADWAGANAGQGAGAFNVTPQEARDLWLGVGQAPLALYTGQNSDENTYVFATGRDNDSGTRLTAFAETGVGIFNQVFQYEPQFGGVVTSLSITNVGSGYTGNPSVAVYGSGGYGYTATPTVTVTGGGGTINPGDLAATIDPTSGAVTSVYLANPNVNNEVGTGFTSAPTIVFNGGVAPAGGVAASASIVYLDLPTGGISEVDLANPGYGATATATETSGTLSSVTLTGSGQGFQSAPTVVVSGGGGSGGAISGKTGNYVVTGLEAWPAETVNGIGLVSGNGGFSSGGTLATALGTTGAVSSVGGYLLSYLGTSDASTATGMNADGTFTGSGLGAKTASYNGFVYTKMAVEEGQYTFWGFEHMYYNNSTLGNAVQNPGGASAAQGVINAVATQISGHDAIIPTSSMNVTRSSDGALVTTTYF